MSEETKVTDKRRFTEAGFKGIENRDGPREDVGAFTRPLPELGLYEPPSAAFSPSSDPNQPATMDFTAALKAVLRGKRVTRLEWEDPETYLLMYMWGRINPDLGPGKYLSIRKSSGTIHQLYIHDGDMLGEDWVVV